jgi:hypothetical protein
VWEGAALEVRNLTIVDGRGDGSAGLPMGGGIHNHGQSLTVVNTTFSSNDGGAISSWGGVVTVSDSVFSSNGEVVFDLSGWPINGGAIFNAGEVLTVANSTFSSNSGGAITTVGGTVSLRNSTFSSNGDGAIHNFGGTLAMSNCTLSGNQGFALRNTFLYCSSWEYQGTATLTNCTLHENDGAIASDSAVAGTDCCGYRGTPCDGFPPSVAVTNSIVVQSAGPTCVQGSCNDLGFGCRPDVGQISDVGHNLQFPDASCGDTIPSVDPRMDPAGLQDNGGATRTIALLPDSPAIDAGDPEVCARPPVDGLDQRGFARPGQGHSACSIGAYEYDSFGPPTTTVGSSTTTTTLPPCSTVRCLVERALAGPVCGDETLPKTIAKKLASAITRVESAPGQSAKKAARLHKSARRLLAKAAKSADRAARGKHPRVSVECGSVLREAIAAAIALVVPGTT